LVFGRHAGRDHRLVGGQSRRAGKEASGADHGVLEVDAVDGEEVGVQVVVVVDNPDVVG
jgi:hypothetical protein